LLKNPVSIGFFLVYEGSLFERRDGLERFLPDAGRDPAEPKALPHAIIIFLFSLSGGGDDDGDDGEQL
jgi:hypothetical protein